MIGFAASRFGESLQCSCLWHPSVGHVPRGLPNDALPRVAATTGITSDASADPDERQMRPANTTCHSPLSISMLHSASHEGQLLLTAPYHDTLGVEIQNFVIDLRGDPGK